MYQILLSPDTGLPKKLGLIRSPVCRFTPTCSEYTRQAVLTYGVFKGILYGINRIRKCTGGKLPEYDPIP